MSDRHPSVRVLAALAAVLLASAACADGDGGEPTPGATRPKITSPETDTETRSRPDTAAANPTSRGPIGTTQQTFVLDPQQPVTTLTSDRGQLGGRGEVRFQVVGRYDGESLPDTLWLGWVPCDNADPTRDPTTFADEDADGRADISGRPDVLLRTVNGDPYENVDQAWPTQVPAEGGELSFALDSYDPACAVPVVFTDENGNSELDLVDDGRPAEPFGVAQVTWQAAD